ncbi:ATP-binding protein [Mucilaginibacter pedocola]|uniref:ATP-binding protein n=1 Tax=Mucilaginibacter pedocola TaxID=1792845 RepID=UPI000993BEA2|nr:ATP-binding protein [Mucilaginibacter pedocola]
MTALKETQLLTAASELLANMVLFAKGVHVFISSVAEGAKGIVIVFEDRGPGIENVAQAMAKGFSTNKGLGHGLPSAKQLCDEFYINTSVGKGTTITITKYC